MMTLNVFKMNLYNLGFRFCFFTLLLHFVCSVYGEQTINADSNYYLNTGDTAKFSCTESATIKALKYNPADGSATEDSAVTVVINANPSATWQCTKGYGESAAKATTKLTQDGKDYVPAFNPFGCATSAGKAKVYCQVVIPPEPVTTTTTSSTSSAMFGTDVNSFFYALFGISVMFF